MTQFFDSLTSMTPMELFAQDMSATYDVDVLFVYYGAAGALASDYYFLVGEYGVNRTDGSLNELNYEIGVAPSGTMEFPGFTKHLSLENVSPLSDLSFVNGSSTELTASSHKGSGSTAYNVFVKVSKHQAA